MMHLPVAGMDVSWGLIVFLGLAVGTLAGFFGVGGGFLLTPLLNALFGIPYSVAVGSSLSQMIGLSTAATIRHARVGNVDYRMGAVMLLGAGGSAELGAHMLESLEGLGYVTIHGAQLKLMTLVMSLLYAGLLSAIGISVWREAVSSSRRADLGHPRTESRVIATLKCCRWRPIIALPVSGIDEISAWVLLGIGVFMGFLSGLLGIGGGFILMPAAVYVIGCPTMVAIGTALFQTIFTAVYGTFTHSLKGNVDPLLVMLMLVGSTIGAQIGAGLTRRFDASRVRGGFAILSFVGVVIVVGKLVKTVLAGG